MEKLDSKAISATLGARGCSLMLTAYIMMPYTNVSSLQRKSTSAGSAASCTVQRLLPQGASSSTTATEMAAFHTSKIKEWLRTGKAGGEFNHEVQAGGKKNAICKVPNFIIRGAIQYLAAAPNNPTVWRISVIV
jgi:hypothetical protein